MNADLDEPLALSAWLDRLARLLPASAPSVTNAEEAAILDLARLAAHQSVRIAAPISTYLVGLAYASLEPVERARALQGLVARLAGGTEG
jgi:hypothetical protein